MFKKGCGGWWRHVRYSQKVTILPPPLVVQSHDGDVQQQHEGEEVDVVAFSNILDSWLADWLTLLLLLLYSNRLTDGLMDVCMYQRQQASTNNNSMIVGLHHDDHTLASFLWLYYYYWTLLLDVCCCCNEGSIDLAVVVGGGGAAVISRTMRRMLLFCVCFLNTVRDVIILHTFLNRISISVHYCTVPIRFWISNTYRIITNCLLQHNKHISLITAATILPVRFWIIL